MTALFAVFSLMSLVIPVAILIWLLALTSRVRELRSRLDELERGRAPSPAPTSAPIRMVAPAPVPLPTPEPIAVPGAPASEPPPMRLPPRPPPPHRVEPPLPSSAPIASAAPADAPAAASAWNAEEVIGSVWLQNVGSVLLLVAVFFLILWGYTTGRLGPGALVAAGVALGGFFAWRGDRVARALPAFGHALVGIGLGVAYLSLYLGHFTLHVLPTPVAFTLLTATSLLAIVAGQHYRVQTIAALGVLGAFVPQVAAALAKLPGFEHHPAGLLAYLAFVNVAVFWLAARSSWSGLALTSVLLSATTWAAALIERTWSGPIEAGLCALFVLLGLAPLRRWAESDEPATIADVALVALAPYALVAASWPYFADASRSTTAAFLGALTAVYAAAAWWIDGRRERQDLWRALLTASVVFGTSALERVLGTIWTPMAWCVEGAALVALGVRPRATWLRGLGYVVLAVGAMAVIPSFLHGSAATPDTQLGDAFPLSALTANSIRCLVAIAAFAVIAHVLERERDALDPVERSVAPQVVHAGGQVFVALWLARHAWNVATVIPHAQIMTNLSADALLRTAPTATAPALAAVGHGLTALLWGAQGAWLVARGLRGRRLFRRVEGYAIGAASAIVLAIALVVSVTSSTGELPFIRLPALLTLAWIALALFVARALGRAHDDLGDDERYASEITTIAAHGALLCWIGVETAQYAHRLGEEFGTLVGYSLTALLWGAQGAWLVVRGLVGSRPFLRVLGYLIGAPSAVALAIALLASATLSTSDPPFVRLPALLTLAWIALAFAIAHALARASDRLGESERRSSEIITLAAHGLLLCWGAIETAQYARQLGEDRGAIVGPALASGAWLVQALVTFAIGWMRRSPFLRQLGLALFGITVLKVTLFDLSHADTFVRAMIAVAVGTALLVVSYVYQRARKNRSTPGAPGPTLPTS